MKVLLIFPPYSVNERYAKDVGNVGGHLPPLGLCYMASMLEKSGHEVQIMDCPVMRYTIEDIHRRIRDFKPDIVGLGAVTMLIDRVIALTKGIKKEFPSQLVVIGGPHPTKVPQDTLEKTGCDIVIQGEAEIAFTEIANNPQAHLEKKIVKGTLIRDLDSMPYPARHLLDMSVYTSLPNNYKKDKHVFQMLTTRGCTYSCTFCASANGMFRQRSVGNVIGEIKQLIEQYNIKEVVFWDDIFTFNKKWIVEFCNALKKENIDIAWSCYTRLDLINDEIVKAMKEAGCWNIFFGIESGNQDILDNIKKKMNLELIRKGMETLKKNDIEVRGSFMIGLPGETPEKARKTIQLAIDLDVDYAQFSITTPYPGTELYDTAERWGTLNKDYKDYHGWVPVFVPHGYKNAEELQAIHREAFRRFYLRPGYILKRMMKLRSMNDLKRNLDGLRLVLGFTSLG